jgi:hypothetical protein
MSPSVLHGLGAHHLVHAWPGLACPGSSVQFHFYHDLNYEKWDGEQSGE